MKKVIRNGKVAVLYSPDFGAGWSTWGAPVEAIFHPKLVELVEAGRARQISEELCQDLFNQHVYLGGAHTLEILWIDQGTLFKIDEYDGAETVELRDDIDWIKA